MGNVLCVIGREGKRLVMNSDYLAMSNATGALDNLINQKAKRAKFNYRKIEENN